MLQFSLLEGQGGHSHWQVRQLRLKGRGGDLDEVQDLGDADADLRNSLTPAPTGQLLWAQNKARRSQSSGQTEKGEANARPTWFLEHQPGSLLILGWDI